MSATVFWLVLGIIGVTVTAIVCVTLVTIKKLSLRCKHQWKTVKEIDLVAQGAIIGYRYIQQCVHCGAIQHVDCD